METPTHPQTATEAASAAEATLPTLRDSTTTADLMDVLSQSATYFWNCQARLQQLFGMDETARAACPNYLELVNDARLGMAAARQVQERAQARLECLAAFPAKWAAWPERRAAPRLDL